MSTIDAPSDGIVASAKPAKPAYRVNFTLMFAAVAILYAIFMAYRVYLGLYGFEAGLDATSPEFDTHWRRLLIIQLPVLFGAGIVCWIYLIVTRDRNMAAITPAIEFKRNFYLALWLCAYTAAVFPLGYAVEQDAVWHQTVMRDSPFSPTHVIAFYAMIPIYLFFGVGSSIYAMTRVPEFSRGISFMHLMGVVGPFLILPNVGFNEWGHAFWLTEEIFSHPLHWGFVVLGWTALALAGVLLQIVMRLRDLFPIVFKMKAAQ